MFDEVSVKIELALDIVVSGRGKPCGESSQEDGQLVARREIGRVDGFDIHHTSSHLGRAVVYSLERDRLKALWDIVARVIDQGTHRVSGQFLTRIRT